MSIPVTQHFSVSEFDCHDGTPYPVGNLDDDGRTWFESRLKPLCDTLEVVRQAAIDAFSLTPPESALVVDSGFRTLAYDNRLHDAHIAALKAKGLPDDHLVAEATSSEHPRGRAADVKHAKLTPVQVYDLTLKLYEAGKLPNLGGVGLYPTFVHLDVRPRPRSSGGPNDGHLAIWGGSRPSNIA